MKYIILRKNTNEQVEDGVCFLKTIIDNYHSNTRSSTKQIRKQLATLNYYPSPPFYTRGEEYVIKEDYWSFTQPRNKLKIFLGFL